MTFALRSPQYAYIYRNLPCTVGQHFVSGTDKLGGSGILEWCIDEQDAKDMLFYMRLYPQFEDLQIGEIPVDSALTELEQATVQRAKELISRQLHTLTDQGTANLIRDILFADDTRWPISTVLHRMPELKKSAAR